MKVIKVTQNSLLGLAAKPLLFIAAALLLLRLLATCNIAVAQSGAGNFSGGVSVDLNNADRILRGTTTIYQTNFRSNTIEVFSLRGSDLGTFATPPHPTGLVFDDAGNLYVSSDSSAAYSILKFAPDGSFTVFANSGLNGPHALVFDTAGSLYVANARSGTIMKFNAEGVATVFADRHDGLASPIDLAFDTAGNLYASNFYGGSKGNGRVLKFTPDGVGSVFADSGFQGAYGLAFDRAGNLYVSNVSNSTIEKFSPTGEDLGVFASTGLNKPLGIMFDRFGNLYACNQGTSTIEKFSPTGEYLGVFADTGGGPHFMTMSRSAGTPTPTPTPSRN